MKARIFSVIVLAASLLVASQVLAQSDGGATFGGQWWGQDKNEAQYQQYRDLARGGYLQDFYLREFNGPWAAAVWGNDALTHNQGVGMTLANGVKWRLDGQYSETPHNINFTTKSPWVQSAPGVFTLPDAVQLQLRADSTAKNWTKLGNDVANAYNSSGLVPLGIQTDVSKARLRLRPIKDWQFEVKGSERQRTGTQAQGATFGMSPDPELAIPISQRMLDVDATGTYTHGPAKVAGSFGVSDFHNNVPTITWDNPWATTDASLWTSNTSGVGSLKGIGSQGRMAMAPDNRAIRGNLSFSVKLPYASTFTATVGMNQTTQKQAFIPITINSAQWGGSSAGGLGTGVNASDSLAGLKANSLAALPATNLDGKVTTVMQDYRLTGRPLQGLFATLRFREEKVDDKTPVLAFIHGVSSTDQTVARITAAGAPISEVFSHKNDVFGLDADYSVNQYVGVSVLAERHNDEHPESREVAKNHENVLGGGLDIRPVANATVMFKYKYGQRRGGSDTSFVATYGTNDRGMLRRFDLADRNQSAFTGSASWSPVEKLDLSIGGSWNKDDYLNPEIGLVSQENTQFYGEAGVHPSSAVDLSGGFGYGQAKADQKNIGGSLLVVSTATSATTRWANHVDDKNAFAYANASWWAKPKVLQFGLDYTFTRDMQLNQQSDSVTTARGLNYDLPASFNRSHDVAVTAHWFYSASTSLGVRYDYTKYTLDDPLAQTIPYVQVPYSASGSIVSSYYLGANHYSYTANMIQVFATRRF